MEQWTPFLSAGVLLVGNGYKCQPIHLEGFIYLLLLCFLFH